MKHKIYSISQTHSTPRQAHKQNSDKWHINSTFTQHFKQCIQEKADCVRNHDLYEICLDWTASDNKNTHISCRITSKGATSQPEHVQRYKIRSAFIFPSVHGTVLTGCQRWVLVMKTIFAHKQSEPVSWLFVDSGKTSAWPQTVPVSLPYSWYGLHVKKIKTLGWRLHVIQGRRENKSF